MIHDDQQGFLPNRRIAINIRKILDIAMSEDPATNRQILSGDFMKCFDRVEISGVIEVMKKFQFAEYLINWVRIIYSKFKLRVQNNGFLSQDINVTRSVRQGGPVSNADWIALCV